MENTSKSRKPNAQWDPTAAKIFNEICVEQVLANVVASSSYDRNKEAVDAR
jgi:hypothetical protein